MELGEKVIRKIAGDGDYGEFDTPTVIRNGPLKGESQEEQVNRPKDLDYLDIPAFLRRQAD